MSTTTFGLSHTSNDGYEPVVGIEVHIELATQTKMFCRCRNAPFDLPPNIATCPTCLGLPGALPVANRQAVLLALRAALALECQMADVCLFERKNYPYPDLVKGFQISQYDLPIGRNGSVTFFDRDGTEKRVRIRRVHLEEDTAKLVHRDHGGCRESWLDCNRSGVPLLEIVTEPEIRSAEDAEQYLRQLRTLMVHNGISACRMQRGEMRLEPNVSVRRVGTEELGPRVEIKNQSSFRFVRDAITFEVTRQTELLLKGGRVKQITCGWDPVGHRTFEQRSKEEAHDYRYFPEPDLPPVRIDSAWIEQQQQERPEPLSQFRRSLIDHGVPEKDIQAIVAAGAASFLYAATHAYPDGVAQLAKWLLRAVFQLMNEDKTDVDDSKLTPSEFAASVKMKADNRLNDDGVRIVIATLFRDGGSAAAIAEERSLFQINDASAIDQAINDVFAERADLINDYRSGKTKVRNALFGMVMKKMAGRANPRHVESALNQRLSS